MVNSVFRFPLFVFFRVFRGQQLRVHPSLLPLRATSRPFAVTPLRLRLRFRHPKLCALLLGLRLGSVAKIRLRPRLVPARYNAIPSVPIREIRG